jgi:hypothetical protein
MELLSRDTVRADTAKYPIPTDTLNHHPLFTLQGNEFEKAEGKYSENIRGKDRDPLQYRTSYPGASTISGSSYSTRSSLPCAPRPQIKVRAAQVGVKSPNNC